MSNNTSLGNVNVMHRTNLRIHFPGNQAHRISRRNKLHAADEAKTCTSLLIAMILQINARLSTTESLGVFLHSTHQRTEKLSRVEK